MGQIINIVEIISLKFWDMLYNQIVFDIRPFENFWYKFIVPKIIIIGKDSDGKYVGIVKIKHKGIIDRLVIYMTKQNGKEKYIFNIIYSEATNNVEARFWLKIHDKTPNVFWDEKEEYIKYCSKLADEYRIPKRIVFQLQGNRKNIEEFLDALKKALDMFLEFDQDFMERLSAKKTPTYTEALDKINIPLNNYSNPGVIRDYVYNCIVEGKILLNLKRE